MWQISPHTSPPNPDPIPPVITLQNPTPLKSVSALLDPPPASALASSLILRPFTPPLQTGIPLSTARSPVTSPEGQPPPKRPKRDRQLTSRSHDLRDPATGTWDPHRVVSSDRRGGSKSRSASGSRSPHPAQ